MNIGICGGTFDPIHRGHIEPVLAVRDTMGWDRLLYVPAFRQPFKTDRDAASGYHRFAMTVLATESRDGFFVTPVELERGAISYTVDTLEAVRAEHPDATLDWIIGDDNVADLPKWKNLDRIFELANFVALARTEGVRQTLLSVDAQTGVSAPHELAPRVTAPPQRGRCGNIVFAPNATVPVSSTEIRRRVRAGEPIDELVDPRVSRYIHHYRLYREAHT